ncbi:MULTISPECIES: nucleotidyltransferase domain-containing protein [Pasteurellaceae]|uniref:Nucleotidyltransferase n=1 Tax=Pasteurella atlantica TaxID=2827233 RepID=A0AAW8CL55_9PAST|nr:nucleotidyltransferase [Pasteurella atlantica]MBR0572969.1 nucleotidyltransferase [Pasteurella atlantica]MDP8038904.1 nucleotidyltransferase [Pasteurella atlantica]MDP8040987.1 nucleotidyltransferase [Pasteurella atlantica]MDP8043123.1 nucleotidyltransferase [Pasteurella atlantica]MDP8045209.1 nucleotidyltransferase [Pasteurella atlantica]
MNIGTQLYTPFNSGSFKKHTAINSKFDLDLVVPFKKNSFSTIEKMFDDVEEKLRKKYESSTVTVRRQKVSLGIIFNSEEINIDVVPAREATKDGFLDDRNLNLHIDLEDKTYLKTNIHNQVEHIKGKDKARSVIRLLKIWKKIHQKNYKSFFIELFVIKAFDDRSPTGTLIEQLKTVLEYIKDKATQEGFQLIDPGNSNNNLMDTVGTQKVDLEYDMTILLSNIEKTTYLEYYFPKNEEFNKSYGVSKDVPLISVPKTERFG